MTARKPGVSLCNPRRNLRPAAGVYPTGQSFTEFYRGDKPGLPWASTFDSGGIQRP